MNRIGDDELLDLESRGCFDYFWREANTDRTSPGYGLVRDRAPSLPGMASIAAVGFGLAALAIGAERGWVTPDEAEERAIGTIETCLTHAEQRRGFFFHFLDLHTGRAYGNSEVSIIDSAIAVCGMLTAGEYFGGEVRRLAEAVYRRVEWDWFRDPRTNLFYMGYNDRTQAHFGAWDHYAEQLMIYFLAAASPTHPVPASMYEEFRRDSGRFGGEPFIHSESGALFVYQFSHAWFDLRGRRDKSGIDWFANSVEASRASRRYAMERTHRFRGFGADSWGLTACDGPSGYNGSYGALPNRIGEKLVDGTVPPCGAAGSLVFTPTEALAALRHYYEDLPELWGPYGFHDAFNLEVKPAWFAPDAIGIDKGITLLMAENYRSALIWKLFGRCSHAVRGVSRCLDEEN